MRYQNDNATYIRLQGINDGTENDKNLITIKQNRIRKK